MRFSLLAAAAVGIGLLLLPAPAEAQRRGVRNAEAYPGARYYAPPRRYSRERARTRITVRRPRTFLDPGTEVLPMSQPYTDYAVPPGYRPFAVVGGASTPAGPQNPHWPLPGAFEIPGYNPSVYGP